MLGDGLKGGSLSRDLASVNTAAGELNGRQNYNVLAGVVDLKERNSQNIKLRTVNNKVYFKVVRLNNQFN
jgi:hypothetical protein